MISEKDGLDEEDGEVVDRDGEELKAIVFNSFSGVASTVDGGSFS